MRMERLRHPGHQRLNALDVGQNHGKAVVEVHDDTWKAIAGTIDPPVGRCRTSSNRGPQFPSRGDAISHPLLVWYSPAGEQANSNGAVGIP